MEGQGPGVFEIGEDHDRNAYRAVYTVRFPSVLRAHAFQMKSPKGIKTDRRDVHLVAARLKIAQEDHEERYGKTKQ